MVAARKSPTFGLLVGLAVTLTAVAVYSGYTVTQLRGLRKLQAGTIDRNRADSLLLLRIQNNLNSLAITMRDMLDQTESYPLIAWKGQMRRIEVDLEDALERIFAMADEREARTRIRLSLEARQEALSIAVARLLVQDVESEQQAAEQTQEIYARAERNAYLFVAAMLILIVATSLYLVECNQGMFAQVASLSQRRSELARQLISIQENTFRHISRELHDEFGQILTAIGAMLQRAGKRIPALDDSLREDFEEVRGIMQSTLDKIRALSQALHPVVLDDAGLEGALHVANNVARNSKSSQAEVRLRFRREVLVLEVEDHGIGFKERGEGRGMGLTSMRERAELIHGRIELLEQDGGGALVRLTVPTGGEAHAG
jgi:signal transduction histidine kinase